MDPITTALVSFAASTAVKQLIQGREPDRGEWEQVAGGLVSILVEHAARAERSLADIEARLDKLAISSFEEHMAAGRRFLEDLRQPRHLDDRREIIHDARSEFVRAVGAGQQLGDASFQAMAEIAIAGCWLWVPSLADAQGALRRAEQLLASAVLDIDLFAAFESDQQVRGLREGIASLRKAIAGSSVAYYKTQMARLQKLLISYEQTVSVGTSYGALAKTIEPGRVSRRPGSSSM